MPSTNAGLQAGLQQPQTTVEAPGGPFIRHSNKGRRTMYSVSGQTWVTSGAVITQPLPGASGYYSGFRLKFAVLAGTTTGVTYKADAPYSIVSLVQLKDGYGTPLITAPGYEALFLIPLYGGQFGLGGNRFVSNLPSWVAGATTGAFTFATNLGLEYAKGFGLLSGANASVQPTLQLNMASGSSVYSAGTVSNTAATLTVNNEADFYWLPDGVNIEPPGLGTTLQWNYQPAYQTFAANSSTSVVLPKVGGYLKVLILEIRDVNNKRQDAWPTTSNLRIVVDGVPLIDSLMSSIYDDMAIQFGVGAGSAAAGKVTRPAGTIAFTRNTGISQEDLGLFDTQETYLSTNPGTILEISTGSWGSGGTGPYTMNVIGGYVIPSGTLVQGLPEI